jgi:hypothetical protein
MAFCGELNVFLHLSKIRILGTKGAFLLLENEDFQKYCIQKLIQFSQANNRRDCEAFNIDLFLWEIHAFLKPS